MLSKLIKLRQGRIGTEVEAVCWHGGLLRPYDKFLNYEVPIAISAGVALSR